MRLTIFVVRSVIKKTCLQLLTYVRVAIKKQPTTIDCFPGGVFNGHSNFA